MSLSKQDLDILKGPFPAERLGIKVQSLSRNKDRALLVCYLQHIDVMNRLEEVDPDWTTDVISEERCGDTVYVRMRMTVKGITRLNVGEGGDPKAAYSDALKRCAMLFGVGRYLYDSETVWVEYDESRDRFKAWTYGDYERGLKHGQKGVPLAQSEAEQAPRLPGWGPGERPSQPKPDPAKAVKKRREAPSAEERTREQVNATLIRLYRPYLTQFPATSFPDLLRARYQVSETRLMTIEQLEDLVAFLEHELEGARV